ncbi:MAG TPA: XRE family transcriptional regulator [Longimicrobium sp.]|jgi:Zn-dependent peptidase ImmA (M78 family)/DNA-binding XRE family transcriptional regulator|uniref:helix-turn-helix domain-containing protein n=1 Tax=Longimicrobium sp. TaxID=2029185 RepID=UPI002ED8C3D8
MNLSEQNARIGGRIRSLREQRGMTQEELAAALRIQSRQSLAAVEAGTRRVSAEELLWAAEALGVSVHALVDPYRLVGEGQFSFRARDVATSELAGFEERAGRWIATYRELGSRMGEQPGFLGTKLELSPRSSFEDAAAGAEAILQTWDLGDCPAERLHEAIDRHMGALVLYVDAPRGISGAASHVPRCNTILVNRTEPPARRAFDLAHELFHLLTWDAMPPARVESPEVSPTKGNRVEKLADNFAAALLMPATLIRRRWSDGGDAGAWLATTSRELRVSTDALWWRLVNLGLVRASDSRPAVAPARTTDAAADREVPLLFSGPFVARISRSVNSGLLSVRRAAGLLDLAPADFWELCRAHGQPLAYDLSE